MRINSIRLAILTATAIAMAPALTAGCGGADGVDNVKYSVSPQRNYDKGLAALEAEEWAAATRYFSFIKSQFPYSKFAVLAELRIADAEVGAEMYLEAIDNYRIFVKLHPTHEMVVNGYVNFRIGEAFFKMLPGDIWIFPPSAEKDQSSTEEAEEELTRFLTKFPDSPYRQKATNVLQKLRRRLCDHEWYVANYYWDRDEPMGTVIRLRRLLERYRGAGYDERALYLLGRAYKAAKLPDRARSTFQELIDKHPNSSQAKSAREAIAGLASR